MASLMVVELRDRAKQILKENLNFPKSMETYLSALHFKWWDLSSPGPFSRATARHQIIGPNLYSEAKTCRRSGWSFCEPRRKKPSRPYSLQTLVLRRR